MKKRDGANSKSLKAKKGASVKHKEAMKRVSGPKLTGKAIRKAIKAERRVIRNAAEEEAKGGGDVHMAG